MSIRRGAALAGLLFVGLFVAAQLISGNTPTLADNAKTVTSFFKDNQPGLLAAAVLEGFAVVALLWFTVGVALMLRDAGQDALAAAALAGGVAAASIGAVVDGVYLGLTQAVALGADPRTIRTLYDVDAFITGRYFWMLLVVVVALLLAGRRGVLPAWTMWLNGAVAALFLLGGASVRSGGAFSPYGAIPLVGFLALLLFIAGTSLVLWRRPAESLHARPHRFP